ITYDGHVMKLRPNQKVVSPLYLKLYCLSSRARRFLMRRAKQTTMTTIGQEEISDLPILLPPLPEQLKIVHAFAVMDDAINKTNQLIAKKELQKTYLMQVLLTGKNRLKGFDGDWSEVRLGDLTRKISRRNR